MYCIIHGKKLLSGMILMIILAVLCVGIFGNGHSGEEAQPVFSRELPVLIIDAGHGGADGGTSSADGLLESKINLEISLKLDALAHFCGVDTVMTRTTEEIDYPAEADTIAKQKVYDQKKRVEQINSYPDGILISIHQNYYPDSRPNGAQVLFGHTTDSQTFGTLLHENLVSCLDPSNRRVAAQIDDSIYLMRNVNCTSVLVECGFLSNPEESARLNTEEYQRKISVVLLSSYLEYVQETT